ncbi:flagellar filament capping protein FliD [Paenibacillus sp. F411]|uniref:flagellar filament capping protein FliD n=1 Tax=Paenibacillus sp. F411 TaxID=2820239 RepID=UPI001AAEF434|nr:flagellar filament capping protein FliD [Paenibacillus sp. F411]MBO2944842.1 flagellar filament capping protein FliD [Paenibacillus sp. F411]
MPMRITGMASGMDIDSIIKQLMNAEKIPYNKVVKKRDLLDYKMNAYREVNLKLSSFRDTMQNFRLSSSLAGSKFTSTDDSKVTVTGSATQSVSHTIEVDELASNAVKSSLASISKVGLTGSALSPSTDITTGVNDTLSISLNGTTRNITLDAGTYDPTQLMNQLQSKMDQVFGPNRITASITGSALQLDAVGTGGSLPVITVNEGNGGLAAIGYSGKQSSKIDLTTPFVDIADKFNTPLTFSSGAGSFKINGVDITFSETSSIQEIMSKVNQSAAGVNMTYDGVSDRVTFTSKTTGVASQIKLENGTGNFLNAIGVDLEVKTGTDAAIKIDGVSSFRDSNTFTIDGLSYTLLDKTTAPVTVKADRDVEGIVNKIKDFVKQFNEVVEVVNTKLTEKKARGYEPLLSEEKKELSETEIKLWEEKVKTGLLYGDSILSGVKSNLSSMLITSVDGVPGEYNSLYEIGLTTSKFVKGGYNPKDAGKIVIDEQKLRKAVEEDPDAVIGLFTNYSNNESSEGIAHRLYNSLNNTVSEISRKAGRSGGAILDASTDLGKQYSDLQADILDWDSRLTKKEDQYYKRFSAMEKALQSSNSQLSWLAQQFQ